MNQTDPQDKKQEPTIAPGINTEERLEEPASAEEAARGDSTPVTRLVLDRTPED